MLIPKALTNLFISHNEFVLVKNMYEYDDMKEISKI